VCHIVIQFINNHTTSPLHIHIFYFFLSSMILKFRFHCSFNPLTLSKLRFWPPKKKTTKQPRKFCTCGSFGPQGWCWLGLRWRGTLSEVPRVFFLFFFLPWEAKTATVAKLRGLFCSFFLSEPKSQLWKS